MKVQIINEYLALAAEKKVAPIKCYNDDDANMLVCNLLDDDKVIIQCLACNYTVKPGQVMYEYIVDKVRLHSENSR